MCAKYAGENVAPGILRPARWLIIEQKDVNATMKVHTVHGREEGVVMGKGMLLVALGCGRLSGILDITARHPFVVFGTMEGKVFAGLAARLVDSMESNLPVYFYETG
jgi:hypothetical protein